MSLCDFPDDDNFIFDVGDVRNEFSKLNGRKANDRDISIQRFLDFVQTSSVVCLLSL